MINMKIATYNIWYPNIDKRAEQLIDTIKNVDADIICLQEVPPTFYEKLVDTLNYSHHAYASHNAHTNDDFGLAFLSKHPISEHFLLTESNEYTNSNAHHAIFEVNHIRC